jgi:hypothetical protein
MGVSRFLNRFPRVAAKRGNPRLSYITASRYQNHTITQTDLSRLALQNSSQLMPPRMVRQPKIDRLAHTNEETYHRAEQFNRLQVMLRH